MLCPPQHDGIEGHVACWPHLPWLVSLQPQLHPQLCPSQVCLVHTPPACSMIPPFIFCFGAWKMHAFYCCPLHWLLSRVLLPSVWVGISVTPTIHLGFSITIPINLPIGVIPGIIIRICLRMYACVCQRTASLVNCCFPRPRKLPE